jgi:hypothetical protein
MVCKKDKNYQLGDIADVSEKPTVFTRWVKLSYKSKVLELLDRGKEDKMFLRNDAYFLPVDSAQNHEHSHLLQHRCESSIKFTTELSQEKLLMKSGTVNYPIFLSVYNTKSLNY